MLQVNHHPVPSTHRLYLMKDSRKVSGFQNKSSPFIYDSMSGIVATLIASHNISISAQLVNDPAFPFIAPVDSLSLK